MVSAGLFGVAAILLSGLVSGLTAAVTYRSLDAGSAENPDLAEPFFAVAALFGAGAVAYGVAELTLSVPIDAAVPVALLLLLFVPWTVFALRYAGRGYLLTRRRITVASLAVAAMAGVLVPDALGAVSDGSGLYDGVLVAVSVGLLAVLGIVFVSAGLVLLATYRHGSLPLASGLAVVLPMGELVFAGQIAGQIDLLPAELLLALSFAIVAVTLVAGVTHYEVLDARPGTSTLGVRAVVEEMNEAVLVVGHGGEIARSNGHAERLFGPDLEGRRLAEVLGADVRSLRDRGTVAVWTREGYREFDPRIAPLTDARDREFGRTLTLIDVTDREIRQQRIQVLNRVLRHNIRNELSAIEARAELALDEDRETPPQIERILAITDDLEELSAEARRIETLMAESTATEADLADVVESAVESAVPSGAEPAVTVDVPDLSVSLDPALLRYALENVVENAIEHNDSPEPRVEVRAEETGTGVRLTVADDGPGIPDSERAVIEAGTEDEHAHASSLGLWGTNWAVHTLGGDLSLGESDLGGTAVTVDLPVGQGTGNGTGE